MNIAPHNRIWIAVSTVVAVLIVSFALLPKRVQGRLVEEMTLQPWPLEWALTRHFGASESELATILEFMTENPEASSLSASPVGLRAHIAGREGQTDVDYPDVLEALEAIDAKFVDRTEAGISVILGFEERGQTSFVASFVYPTNGQKIRACDSIESGSRGDYGYCGVELNADWYLVYDWMLTS
ncbi:MAG: hypothetical protein AAFN50_09425 [Pseudomonadota bacterium]